MSDTSIRETRSLRAPVAGKTLFPVVVIGGAKGARIGTPSPSSSSVPRACAALVRVDEHFSKWYPRESTFVLQAAVRDAYDSLTQDRVFLFSFFFFFFLVLGIQRTRKFRNRAWRRKWKECPR